MQRYLFLFAGILSLSVAVGATALQQDDEAGRLEETNAEFSVASSYYGLLERLLERDGHLEEFSGSAANVGTICVDWDRFGAVRENEVLYIEHYWINDGEELPEDAAEEQIKKCQAWARESQNPECDCVTIVENNKVQDVVPQDLNVRAQLASQAYRLMTRQETRERYQQIDSLIESETLLTNPNSPRHSALYPILASMQRNQCVASGQSEMECRNSKAECLELAGSFGGGLGDPEAMEYACSVVSTPFEFPGAYWLLWRLHNEVDFAAHEIGYGHDIEFAFGSLNLGSINVSITPIKGQTGRIVVFDQAFFSFVYEMAKVSSFTLDLSAMQSGDISYSSDEDDLSRYLDQNPHIQSAFKSTVRTFLGLENRPPMLPDLEHAQIILAYTDGAELFAMAHEYGHAYLGHTDSGEQHLEPKTCSVDNVSHWLNEVKADYVGSNIVQRVSQHRKACSGAVLAGSSLMTIGQPLRYCQNHPFNVGLPLSPVFYFTAQEIKNEACGEFFGEMQEFDASELAIVEFAERCSSDPECDFLADVDANIPEALRDKRGYPHPSVRAQLARIWVEDKRLLNRSNPVSSIGLDLTRNARIVWDRARED